MSVKDNVITLLREASGEYVSGQALADKLNVSRNAVWKAVKELTAEGYSIDRMHHMGYKLTSTTDIISEREIRGHLKKFPDIPIHVFEKVDSTNKTAKEMALQGAPSGTLVVSEMQTGGRGRLGRSFSSPKNTGIYMSLIVRPESLLERAPLITTAASVAVAKGVRELCGKEAVIKWVNDVYIENKKICGILTEAISDVESGMVESAVVGIGINFYPRSFPEELKDVATSVFTDRATATRCALIAYVADELLDIIAHFPDASFIETYRLLSMVIGKRVALIKGGEETLATALDIDDHGGLIVDIDGTVETLRTGEISLRLRQI